MRSVKKILLKIIRILPFSFQRAIRNIWAWAILLKESPVKQNGSSKLQPDLKVTVVCLVYKSTGYIDFVWDSFNKHTKNANFLFIANDATEKVKTHLKEKNLPHLLFENENKEEYYLNRVYRAWNYGGKNATGEIIVFVNSDMAFSDGWLENLIKYLDKDKVICSRLVESGKLLSGRYAIMKNFGKTYKEFSDIKFNNYSKKISRNELRAGGLYMPCAIFKETFIKSGGYPIGNRKEVDGSEISGDYILFYEKLATAGVCHYTSFDSLVYHVQEGEMDE